MQRIVVSDSNTADFASRVLTSAVDYLVVDVETTGLRPYHGDTVVGIALHIPDEVSFYVPREGVFFSEALKLTPTAKTVVGFNLKFDLHFLGLAGMRDPDRIEDVMLAAHLLNENESLSNGGVSGAYQLKRLARKYLGADSTVENERLLDELKALGLSKSNMHKLPLALLADYAMADVELTWRLRQFYMPALERWGQVELYHQRSAFVLHVLLRMERNGVRVDLGAVKRQADTVSPGLQAIEDEFNAYLKDQGIDLCGGSDQSCLPLFDTPQPRINLNSPQQVKQFFNIIGIELSSTDKHVLEPLARVNRWGKLLLEYRTLSKMLSTYYLPYLDHVAGGYIHTTLNPIGTVTGRLSSYSPNLQQIPRGSNNDVRRVFVPREGYAAFGTDYRQLELRLAVHYANEEVMRTMFNAGDDLHQWTADRLGVSRQVGKGANFGLIYGMGAARAQTTLGLSSLEEAERVVSGWRELYPQFMVALKHYEKLARTWRAADGSTPGDFQYIRLFNNRVRHFNEYLRYIEPPDIPPYKDAWNFYIQGTGAALMEISALKLCQMLDNDVFKPVLLVHDAIEYEVLEGHYAEVVALVDRVMTDYDYNPRLETATEIGVNNWLDMETFKP